MRVINCYENNRVVGVTREIYQGTRETVAGAIRLTQGKGEVNTASIERLNGTFRGRLNSVVRPTRSPARQS